MGQLGAGAASLQPELDDCRLFLGGDVGADSVHILHGVPGVAGAAEILPGVYVRRRCGAGAAWQRLRWPPLCAAAQRRPAPPLPLLA